MPGNELQYSLIGVGITLILALVVYNLWQERKARKHAETVFRSTHHDVLLDGDQEEVIPPAPGGRMEPTLPTNSVRQINPSPASGTSPPRNAAKAPQSSSIRAQEPVLPWEMQAIDCAVAVEAPAGVSAAALFIAQQSLLAGISKPLQWFGWDDSDHCWISLDARSPGSLNRACAALQLVDRRGALNAQELERFYDQMQLLCDQFLAVPRLPARLDVMKHAAEIDRFCSEVDIQIAVNVIAQDTAFAGTKIRGLAEAANMVLRADGSYYASDEEGRTLFTLSNQEAAAFSAEQLRHLHTHGVTLAIDVPRVTDPVSALDKMISFAHHIADALQGHVVDDNRVALGERSIGLIRNQVGQFEQHMERQAIPAGGEIALRLFS
ncbi:MAG TPA: cell division protein ZipA C-terminal FtsZ-binding domain-containing protein [Rhodocyclaceae bacterium]|nr:cell division protein ZipA C-terminal FtsZ-binding domain-containing protein [Rhodocyclaceae bacterium]